MEFVRADHRLVPEEAAADVLDAADQDEEDGLDDDQAEGPEEQATVPGQLAQEDVGEREGDEEEADFLQPFGEVLRVERLQRVDHDEDGERFRHPSRFAFLGRRRQEDRREDARADDDVERDQQVGRFAARFERDAEGERADDRERHQDRPADEHPGQGDHQHDPDDHRDGRFRLVVAQFDDLVVVPLVAEDQDREEDQRGQHRGAPHPPGGQQDRGAGAGRGDQHARAGEEVADAQQWPRLCRRIGPGRVSSRPSSSSITRTR